MTILFHSMGILVILTLVCVPSAESPGLKPSSFVPADSVVADVMIIEVPPRALELFQQFQEAIGKDPEWLMAYVAEMADQKPLPYHPNFGLSEQEYREYLSLAGKMTLIKAGEVVLRITVDENGILHINTNGLVPDLDGIAIDLANDRITTRFGTAHERSEIIASEGQELTGPWNGVQWKLDEGDPNTLQSDMKNADVCSIRFALGRLQDSGRGLLYYKATRISPGPVKDKAMVVLMYSLSEAPSPNLPEE